MKEFILSKEETTKLKRRISYLKRQGISIDYSVKDIVSEESYRCFLVDLENSTDEWQKILEERREVKRKEKLNTKKRLNNIFVWDIETCLDSEEEREKELKLQRHRCWYSCIASIENDKVIKLDTSIETAYESLCDIAEEINKENAKSNALFYAHNAKFDVSYLKAYLLENDFIQHIPVFDEDFNDVADKLPNSFYITETEQHQFYKIDIFTNRINSKGDFIKVVIKDSYKKIPMSVAKIAKSWELEVQKGDLDYTRIRPLGYVPTEEEKDYIVKDCIILTKVLREFYELGFEEATISSSAFQRWKNICFQGAIKHLEEKTGKTLSNSQRRKLIEEKFRDYFPSLPKEADNFIRKSYKGGITFVNPKFKGVSETLSGKVYDVNSLYPSVMFNTPLPFGKPKQFEGKFKPQINKGYILFIQKVYVPLAYLKEKETFPFIQIKDKTACKGEVYKSTDYLSEFANVELNLTNIELDLFLKHYEVEDIEYLGGVCFRSSKTIFNEYIDVFIEQKKANIGGKREIAKLMLNSLYGKFATNPNRCSLNNYLDTNGIVKTNIMETHCEESNYTATASFITAYARRVLVNAVYSIPYSNFYYCDTDSIHLYDKDDEGNEIDLDQDLFPVDFDKTGDLGLWKLEGDFIDAKYLAPKKYMELIREDKEHDYEWDVKCCGLPSACKSEIKDKKRFHYGQKFNNKKAQLNGVGGIRIVDTSYKIMEFSLF